MLINMFISKSIMLLINECMLKDSYSYSYTVTLKAGFF